ncbi:ChrR family anti-sigma-E factor [Rhodoblastus sp.]|uniref:ChrR family anti-sigma-E factor n=1 Tax=Rhodoblastus sp. TaxID=1962975 RepID=UPI0026036D63|nr:ChrR family anti-sigma-E factor [Rhodoblastus sp.]
MTASAFKHASDETLQRYACGNLKPGLALVMRVHLAGCLSCRANLRRFEAVGGALLDNLPPAAISPALLEKIFARIDAGDTPREARPTPVLTADGFALPAAMAGCKIGPWRFVHPKLRWARVEVPGAETDRVILLKIAAGFAAPAHGHGGLELTQVLAGGFTDGRAQYEPGDLVEADESLDDHEPRVTGDEDCLCLAAVEKPLRIRSLLGRLFQPLMGI